MCTVQMRFAGPLDNLIAVLGKESGQNEDGRLA